MYLTIITINLMGCMSPGPDLFLVIKNSLLYGKRAGIYTTMGICLALTVHIFYTISGFSLLLKSYPFAFKVLQFIGAAYLLYIGVKSFFSKQTDGKTEESSEPDSLDLSAKRSSFFYNGLICNLFNPKVSIFFLSIFSQYIKSEDTVWVHLSYGALCILTAGLWFMLLSSLITLPKFKDLYTGYSYWIERVFGLILIVIAVKIVSGAI